MPLQTKKNETGFEEETAATWTDENRKDSYEGNNKRDTELLSQNTKRCSISPIRLGNPSIGIAVRIFGCTDTGQDPRHYI
jgi:hypothetical protein